MIEAMSLADWLVFSCWLPRILGIGCNKLRNNFPFAQLAERLVLRTLSLLEFQRRFRP